MPGGDGGNSPEIVFKSLRNLSNGGVPQNLEFRGSGSYGDAAASLPVGGRHQVITQGSVPVDSLHRGGCHCCRQHGHVGGKEGQIYSTWGRAQGGQCHLNKSPHLPPRGPTSKCVAQSSECHEDDQMVSSEAGGCGNHYCQDSLVGEIYPQKGHPRIPRRLLHEAIQPSPQSMLPLPAFRPCGDRLQGRVCQVQALRREPCYRTLPSKEGSESGGGDKMCKLSGPSSCFQHEMPQAERVGKDHCGRPGGAKHYSPKEYCQLLIFNKIKQEILNV